MSGDTSKVLCSLITSLQAVIYDETISRLLSKPHAQTCQVPLPTVGQLLCHRKVHREGKFYYLSTRVAWGVN